MDHRNLTHDEFVFRPTFPDRWLIVGIADAMFSLASVTNGPVSPADATNIAAIKDKMNRISYKEVPSVPERNERVGAFVTLRLRHSLERKTRRGKSSAGRSLNHARYVKAQVKAARSEAAWTPHTTE